MLTEYEKSTFLTSGGRYDIDNFDAGEISIKLFTHDDLDGFGCYLVLKNLLDLAFEDTNKLLERKGDVSIKEHFVREILDEKNGFTGYSLDVTVCSNSNINDMVDYCGNETEYGLLDYDIILFSDIVPDESILNKLEKEGRQFFAIDHHKTNLKKMEKFPDKVKVQPTYKGCYYNDKITGNLELLPACGTILMHSFCIDMLFPNIFKFEGHNEESALKDVMVYGLNRYAPIVSLNQVNQDIASLYFEFLENVLLWDTFLFDKTNDIVIYYNLYELKDELSNAECLNFAFNSLIAKCTNNNLNIGDAFKEIEEVISDNCIFISKEQNSDTLQDIMLEYNDEKFTLRELGQDEFSKLLNAEKYMIVGENPITVKVSDCDLITSRESSDSLTTVTFNVLYTNSNVSWLSKRYLTKNPDIDIAIIISGIKEGDILMCSIRTRKPNIDVSTIAKQFNGGGHPQASGFSTSMEYFGTFIKCLTTAQRLDLVKSDFM